MRTSPRLIFVLVSLVMVVAFTSGAVAAEPSYRFVDLDIDSTNGVDVGGVWLFARFNFGGGSKKQ